MIKVVLNLPFAKSIVLTTNISVHPPASGAFDTFYTPMPESSSTREPPLVVLNLSETPPATDDDAAQWHWRKIAGVPFVLRNMLTIQRSGADCLEIYLGENPRAIEDLRQKLLGEPRLRLKWELIGRNFSAEETEKLDKRVLVLEGDALHEKSEVGRALEALSGGGVGENAVVEILQGLPGNRLREEKDFLIQHDRLLRTGGGLGNDSLITRYLSRTVSTRLTRLIIDTSFTPNQVTVFSFILGLVSAALFFKGGYWPGVIGGALLVLSTWVDGVDGELARIKFMESRLGAKLDIYCDNVVHFFLFLAIGLGLSGSTGRELYTLLGIIAAVGSLLSFFMLNAVVTASKSTVGKGSASKSGQSLAEKMANRDFIHLIFLLTLFGRVDIFLWLTATGVTIFCLYLIYLRLRPT